jgi:hypothetical protein
VIRKEPARFCKFASSGTGLVLHTWILPGKIPPEYIDYLWFIPDFY